MTVMAPPMAGAALPRRRPGPIMYRSPNQASTQARLCSPAVTAMAPPAVPALRCRGADLVDENGALVKLKGVNWFGFNTGTTMVDGLWGSDPLVTDFAAVVLRQKLLGASRACAADRDGKGFFQHTGPVLAKPWLTHPMAPSRPSATPLQPQCAPHTPPRGFWPLS